MAVTEEFLSYQNMQFHSHLIIIFHTLPAYYCNYRPALPYTGVLYQSNSVIQISRGYYPNQTSQTILYQLQDAIETDTISTIQEQYIKNGTTYDLIHQGGLNWTGPPQNKYCGFQGRRMGVRIQLQVQNLSLKWPLSLPSPPLHLRMLGRVAPQKQNWQSNNAYILYRDDADFISFTVKCK